MQDELRGRSGPEQVAEPDRPAGKRICRRRAHWLSLIRHRGAEPGRLGQKIFHFSIDLLLVPNPLRSAAERRGYLINTFRQPLRVRRQRRLLPNQLHLLLDADDLRVEKLDLLAGVGLLRDPLSSGYQSWLLRLRRRSSLMFGEETSASSSFRRRSSGSLRLASPMTRSIAARATSSRRYIHSRRPSPALCASSATSPPCACCSRIPRSARGQRVVTPAVALAETLQKFA